MGEGQKNSGKSSTFITKFGNLLFSYTLYKITAMHYPKHIICRLPGVIIILVMLSSLAGAQSLQDIESHRVSLPNGWKLTPVGKMLPLGDLPLNIAVSPSKKYLAVTNNGQSDQTVQLIDAAGMK